MLHRVKGKASSSWHGFHLDITETFQSDQTINAHMQARQNPLKDETTFLQCGLLL